MVFTTLPNRDLAPVVEDLHRFNLCTHYILPLLSINSHRFCGGNFQGSYLTDDLSSIVVKVYDYRDCIYRLKSHPCFSEVRTEGKFHYMIFIIPEKWKFDVMKYTEGKYSQMSARAKEYIIQFSALTYQQADENGTTISDIRILALDRDPSLKKFWEENLGVTEPPLIGSDYELLSKPDERSFIDLSLAKKVEI